jgi:hypothetical protein
MKGKKVDGTKIFILWHEFHRTTETEATFTKEEERLLYFHFLQITFE